MSRAEDAQSKFFEFLNLRKSLVSFVLVFLTIILPSNVREASCTFSLVFTAFLLAFDLKLNLRRLNMKKCDWGWQGEAKKLRLRAGYLLTNLTSLPIPTDITLEFGKDGSVETVSAHKIFLAIGSEVFMAMFYGPAADATQTKVLIPNYSKTVFEALVHYLYSDRIPDSFSALKDGGLWMELLECAVQYGVPELATRCRVAITNRLSVDDAWVCKILVEARRMDETEIEKEALRALDRRPISIISKSPDITVDLLAGIVQRSELDVAENQEIELYKALRRWAISGREKSSKEPCSEVCEHCENCEHCTIKKDPVRQQLGPAFKHIRFPLMSASQLAHGPVKDGTFTGAELSQLFASKLPTNAPPMSPNGPFSSTPRQTKLEIDSGELTIQYKLRGGDEIDWEFITQLIIVPDWDTCPDTSRRFIKLCGEGYQFSLVAQSRTILVHQQQEEFDVNPIDNIRNMFLPLPTSENSLMHDSGGTVSLCLAQDDNGEGSHYKLLISPDKGQKDTGTVFGRLDEWDAKLGLLKTVASLNKVVECKVGAVTNATAIDPYSY